MREDNGSGYKLTCANEEAVDETGSSRKRELVYELSAKGFGLSGLGWHPSVDLGRLVRCTPGLHLGAARLGAGLGAAPFTAAGRRKEGKGEEKERKRKKKEKRGERGW